MKEYFDDIDKRSDTSEGANIDEINKNNEESNENFEEKLQKEEETVENQGQDNDQKAQNNREEVERTQKDGNIDTKNTDKENSYNESASSTYEPPNYIPRMTYGNFDPFSNDNGVAKEKRRSSSRTVAACVVLSVVIAIFVGSFSGIFAVYSLKKTSGNGITDAGTVIKNNGRVEVNKVIQDEDYAAMDVAGVAATVKDSVVEITTSSIQTDIFIGQYVTSGAGSGVIILQTETEKIGYIVTNYHVVEGAKDITVRLTNGNEYKAAYRAGDEAMDIAVIEIQAKEDLVCAEIGNSDKLAVGDEVIAIGNPLGELGGTVTNGIVSALERKIIVGNNAMVLLQTNAAINPGNSGGGLFDMGGKLVGIVNSKQSAAGIEGLGFAIPINRIEQAIEDILSEDGYVKGRPSLDITVSYDSRFGLYITSAAAGSPLSAGERIVSINGTEINSELEYNIIVSGLEIGSKAKVRVARYSGFVELAPVEVSVTVTENTSI